MSLGVSWYCNVFWHRCVTVHRLRPAHCWRQKASCLLFCPLLRTPAQLVACFTGGNVSDHWNQGTLNLLRVCHLTLDALLHRASIHVSKRVKEAKDLHFIWGLRKEGVWFCLPNITYYPCNQADIRSECEMCTRKAASVLDSSLMNTARNQKNYFVNKGYCYAALLQYMEW